MKDDEYIPLAAFLSVDIACIIVLLLYHYTVKQE